MRAGPAALNRRGAPRTPKHMMLMLCIAALIVLSCAAGFITGRVYGLELAARRIVRAYQEL